MKDFFRFDIIESGIETVKDMFENSSKSVKDYFKTEETGIKKLNPFLLNFILAIYFKIGGDYILDKDNYLPCIFNMILYMILILQEDKSGSISKLYSTLLSLLNFVEKNLQACVKNGTMEKLLNS